MNATPTKTTTPTTTTPTATARPSYRLALLCAVSLWVALFGPAWTYIPARPEMQIPAISLNFAEMAAGASQSPSGLQQAFFGWIAWALALITTILALLAARWSSRLLGGLCILMGLAELILTAYGMKGTTAWSAVIDGMDTMRLGSVLYLLGLVLLIPVGAIASTTK